MAERVGFEPTVAKGYTRSPGVPDSPLQHLSAAALVRANFNIKYLLSNWQYLPAIVAERVGFEPTLR